MVTKLGRHQVRRTNTPGKVPAPTDLKEYELGLNSDARKLYSKDTDGNVFQMTAPMTTVTLGGSSASPPMSVPRDVAVEPAGAVYNKDTHLLGDEPQHWIVRRTTHTNELNPTPGTTNPLACRAAGVLTQVQTAVENYEFNFSAVLSLDAVIPVRQDFVGLHCGYNVLPGAKGGNAYGWGLNIEVQDLTDVSTASLSGGEIRGCELTYKASGTDPDCKRIGAEIIFFTDPASAHNAEMGVGFRVTCARNLGAPIPPSKVLIGFHANSSGLDPGHESGVVIGFKSDALALGIEVVGQPSNAAIRVNTNNQAVMQIGSALSDTETTRTDYFGRDSLGADATYAQHTTGFGDNTAGDVDGRLEWKVAKANVLTEALTVDFGSSESDPIYLFVGGLMRNVTVGAADSGGSGKRALTVLN